jgi:hypothetical protein
MISNFGFFYGGLFLLGGILGLMPGLTEHDMFLGIFMVNTLHNFLHLVSGTMFLVASLAGAWAARLWFWLFGLFYGALSAMGFWVGDGLILNLITNNLSDSWGHAGLSLSMLAVGLFVPRQAVSA